jgi:hypothetical protein
MDGVQELLIPVTKSKKEREDGLIDFVVTLITNFDVTSDLRIDKSIQESLIKWEFAV